MYNVRLLLDRAEAIVERLALNATSDSSPTAQAGECEALASCQGQVRESCGRGDMNNDTKLSSTDTTRFDDANANTIWDPRADLPLTRQATRSPRLRLQTPGVFRRVKGMDDDGDVDANDETLYDNKYSDWSGAGPPVDPRQALDTTRDCVAGASLTNAWRISSRQGQAFRDKGNPFMPALYVAKRCQGFQGIPHFALDTASSATEGKLMLNHHRARFADGPTGSWCTRDPSIYNTRSYRFPPGATIGLIAPDDQSALYAYLGAQPLESADPSGLAIGTDPCYENRGLKRHGGCPGGYLVDWRISIKCPPERPYFVQRVTYSWTSMSCNLPIPQLTQGSLCWWEGIDTRLSFRLALGCLTLFF